MKVEKIFINTYRYDFHLAQICIASIRYWYPGIPIFLIKDESKGKFNTKQTERRWNVNVAELRRKNFDWGYGKLETLFLDSSFSFLVLDADTVLTGPVLDKVEGIDADFIVDNETQPASRFNEIYYNLERINEIDQHFQYPGYSFNSGQWFGTTGKITREDFDLSLEWTEPPQSKFPQIVFKGDQAHLNFALHRLEQQNRVSVARIPLMLWPKNKAAEYISLNSIRNKSGQYSFIIHWAGMGINIAKLPRRDILSFYQEYFDSGSNKFKLAEKIRLAYLMLEKKIKYKLSSR